MDFKLDKKMTKNLKMVTAGLETMLALPYMGGYLSLSLIGFPLFILFVLHIFTLYLSFKNGAPKAGSIVGILINFIFWMPLIGFFGRTMHLIAAVLLWIDFTKMNDESDSEEKNEFESNNEANKETDKK